ncbi:unnamed protein product [Bursaphelenchus xylophilus]|uniref:(pine wood nematode) hypothetical protein n=1 Tax=Bursaphelenchus xylophilus TaxID=6326 RepID=A0A1I7S1X5_BURXY|nr:unnamed protein product [Bursaphelenchus xylophilus]CAG9090075.1 unnamed protein product [Bursaphelenchus xylophilus]
MQTLASGALLIGYSAFLYFTDQYWLLGGVLPLISGILLVISRPSQHKWRFLVMFCISIGTLITLFYTFTSIKYRQSSLVPDSTTLNTLTKDTLGAAFTVFITASGFYSARRGRIGYGRLLVLGVILALMLFSVLNAGCNNFPALPYCSLIKF